MVLVVRTIGMGRVMRNYTIAVVAGDGIGPEVTVCAIDILNRASGVVGGFGLTFVDAPAGAELYL